MWQKFQSPEALKLKGGGGVGRRVSEVEDRPIKGGAAG